MVHSEKRALSRNIKLTLYGILTVLIVGFFVISYLFLTRFSGLEEEAVYIPSFTKIDTLKIPPRPGIQGVVISGPVISDLIFDINLKAADIQPLDWNKLKTIDRTAEVTVRAKVAADGRLIIKRDQGDILDRGHPDAGREIEKSLSTWVYFPYREGDIFFYFNVPSKGLKKVIIDATKLKRSKKIPKKNEVQNGLLHYIKGLDQSEIGYSSVQFK